jgi:hypothetical protein
MKKYPNILPFFLLFLICITNCKKDEVDPRIKYLGHYNFIANEHVYNLHDTAWHDTIVYYLGTINSIYGDLYAIDIWYLPGTILKADLYEDGSLKYNPNQSPHDAYFSGKFVGTDKVSFEYSVPGLSSYKVTGNKR